MSDATLPGLHDCLAAASWRRLLAIMAGHGLPCSTRWLKADLIAALYPHLLDPTTWRQRIPELSAAARSALDTLLQSGGALPAVTFLATFGQIRPHRPWREAVPEPAPWQAPASPAERLWYLGLIYLDPPASGPGTVQRVLIPAELLPILHPLLLTPEADQPIALLPQPGHPPDLAWHVALLLASVEAEPLAPVRGRWLPPTTIAALADRMGLDHAVDYAPVRTEHRLPYLAFVHLLAEAAGLVGGATRFIVTPAGWQWLAAPAAARWSALWAAWLAAPVDLTGGYRFPWANTTPAGRRLVLDQFDDAALGQFRPLRQITEAAHLRDPHGYLAQPWRVPDDVAAALITGPLFWFGAVDLAGTPEADPSVVPLVDLPDDDDQPAEPLSSPLDGLHAFDPDCDRDLTFAAEAAREEPQPALVPSWSARLTLTGAWLSGRPDCAAPQFPNPAACSSATNDPDLLNVPVTALPMHLARLAPLADWLSPVPPAMTQPLRLTARRVGQAVANGLAWPQLLDALTQALGRPPSRRQTQRLRQWAAAGQQVRIRHLTVLETADAALLGQLRSRKLIRRHLGAAISPTRVILDPAAIPAVIQHLATLDLYAGSEPVAAGETAPPAQPGSRLDPAAAGLLYTAGLVYRGLGEHLSLAAPLSAAVLDDLAAGLDARQREAAAHAAQQALEDLDATLRGYLGLPAWQADREPADALPLIEQALARKRDLLLTYWGAGREQAVVRRVTPYWVERRQAVAYLVGYCHLREAERIFRIDRIVECRVLPPNAPAPAPDGD